MQKKELQSSSFLHGLKGHEKGEKWMIRDRTLKERGSRAVLICSIFPKNGTAHLKKHQRERRECLLKTTWKKRCTAGFLAILLGCSSLLTGTGSAMAAPLEQAESKRKHRQKTLQ